MTKDATKEKSHAELGINNTVANYMTTMFDAGYQQYLKAEMKNDPKSTTMNEIEAYDTFLDNQLKFHKLTMAELMGKMAIK